MKLLFALFLAVTFTAAAFGQTKSVVKTISGNALTEDLVLPGGRTLSGAGTFNFGAGTVTLPTTVSGGTGSLQPLDATLTAFGAIPFNTAGQVAYATGTDTFATVATTTFARTLWDDASAAATRTTLGLVIGTDVQAWSSALDSIAGNGSAYYLARANHTGSQAWSTLTGTPTTLAGYGITDALTDAETAAAYQPLDTDLTAIAALDTATFGRGLLAYTDVATLRAVLALDSSHVGLGNVENVALSTWGGSTNLTTLGLVQAGEWQGAVIGAGYGGAGTVTGLMKANGLGTVSAAVAGTDYLAAGAVTTSGLTMTTARLLGRSTATTGAIEEITVGSGLDLTAGTLTATGAGGFSNPMTTAGDLITGGTAGAAQRLGVGSDGQILSVVSGAPAWAAAPTTGAPTDATYITQTANGTLSAEQALADLATGILKSTTTTGVLSIAAAGTDFLGVPASSAEGDILFRNATTWERLPRGTDGQVLKSTATTVAWGTDATGGGSLPATPSDGDLAYYVGAEWLSLPIGTAGQVLTVNGGATAPEWATGGGGGFSNPMTTAGDLITGGTAGAAQRLGVGTDGQVLKVVSGAPAWGTDEGGGGGGTGDVVGPGTAGATTTRTYASAGDTNGAIYWLATKGLTTSWTNPHTANWVVATRSSEGGETGGALMVDRAANGSYSDNVVNSWAAIDLGSYSSLVVSQYSLRNRSNAADSTIRNWKLQGSNDAAANTVTALNAATWTDIDVRVNDTTMPATTSSWATYTVSGTPAAYRWLRVIQTGANSGGQNYFGVSEFEFYGELTYMAGAPLPNSLVAWANGVEVRDSNITQSSSGLNIPATTTSSSATTGALVVAGGVGIGGAINVTGAVTSGPITTSQGVTASGTIISGTSASTSPTTGSLRSNGGLGVAGAVNAGGAITTTATTASTSTTTGALISAGGLGVAGDINAASVTLNNNSAYKMKDSGGTARTIMQVDSTNHVTVGATGVSGDLKLQTGGLASALVISATTGNTAIASTTASTSTTTGALTVAGGVGVAGTVTASGVVLTGSSPPASATAAGVAGTVTWDANYVYICVATNTWKRAALSSW